MVSVTAGFYSSKSCCCSSGTSIPDNQRAAAAIGFCRAAFGSMIPTRPAASASSTTRSWCGVDVIRPTRTTYSGGSALTTQISGILSRAAAAGNKVPNCDAPRPISPATNTAVGGVAGRTTCAIAATAAITTAAVTTTTATATADGIGEVDYRVMARQCVEPAGLGWEDFRDLHISLGAYFGRTLMKTAIEAVTGGGVDVPFSSASSALIANSPKS